MKRAEQRQKEEVKKQGLNEKIFHIRFDDNSVITVVHLINSKTNTTFEGLSICSPSDTFSRQGGRVRARGRVLKSIARGFGSPLWRDEWGNRNEALQYLHKIGMRDKGHVSYSIPPKKWIEDLYDSRTPDIIE